MDPCHIALLKYWMSKCGARPLPSRAELDPLEIVPLLPRIGLIEVYGSENLRFRYRLIGTEMVQTYGIDYTGTWVDESKSGFYADLLINLYSEAARTMRPRYSSSVFTYLDNARLEKEQLAINRLILPLSSDQNSVDLLLFSNVFDASHAAPERDAFPASQMINAVEVTRLDPTRQ